MIGILANRIGRDRLTSQVYGYFQGLGMRMVENESSQQPLRNPEEGPL